MKAPLLAGALLSLVAFGAHAADAPGSYRRMSVDTGFLPYGSNWTGLYAGGHVGFGFGGGYSNVPQLQNPWGFLLGVQGGYDYQYQRWVFGGAADFSFSNVGRSDVLPANGYQYWAASLRGRAGYLMQDNLLLYGTLGFAFGNGRVETLGVGETKSMFGWLVGVGGEYQFTRNWSAMVEYRYTDYGTQPFTLGGGATQVGNSGHTLRTGINYRF